jgi:predicted peptidase
MSRFSRIAVATTLIAAVLASGGSAEAAVDDFLAGSHYSSAANLTIPYRLFVPEDYDPDRSYPLILFLHGAGERGSDNIRQVNHNSTNALIQKVKQDQFSSFLLAPQAPSGSWATNGDAPTRNVQTVMEILELLQDEYSIDNLRLYLTGLSLGGMGTWDMMCRYNDYFAAGVPICGNGDTSRAGTLIHKPIWAFHAADDGVVSVYGSRNMINAIRFHGGDPLYTEYESGGHGIWVRAYQEPELFPWLFAQTLAVPGMPGDANRDGVVTDADYTLWADNFGAVHATWEMGDFDGSGIVTMADYTIWAENYEQAGEVEPIPEPAALLLLAAGSLLIRARGRGIYRGISEGLS